MNRFDHKHFDAFFRALNEGKQPFPWQRRLAEKLSGGDFPEWIVLPTGSGKSHIVDLWLYALFLNPEQVPRRLVLVNNRRVVVDNAYERATKSAERLRQATDPVLREVAERLKAIGASSVPLGVHLMRGGIAVDDEWLELPSQAALIVGTVEQIGSRLLMRAYHNVSSLQYSIHAGLLGNDAYIILDEAHINLPFLETLRSIARYRALAERPILLPFAITAMSATAPEGVPYDPTRTFTLEEEDYRDDRLGRRIFAGKSVKLVKKTVAEENNAAKDFGDFCNLQIRQWIAEGRGRVFAVVLNQVNFAKQVYAHLATAAKAEPQYRCLLLVGRMRPVDREIYFRREPISLLTAGADRDGLREPLVVVATQSIEVGADFDFDGMITMSASADAIVQRFGRLNRVGRLQNAVGCIVHLNKWIDPVYGESAEACFDYLLKNAKKVKKDLVVEMDIQSISRLDLKAFYRPSPHPVRLLPHHLDCLSITSPLSSPCESIDLFLHGENAAPNDVLVIARADIAPYLSRDARVLPEPVRDALEKAPPSIYEAIAVPYRIFAAWSTRVEAPDEGDITPLAQPDETERLPSLFLFSPVVVYREQTYSLARNLREIRPGDVVILPLNERTRRRWLDLGHFADYDDLPAGEDVAELVAITADKPAFLRVVPTTLRHAFMAPFKEVHDIFLAGPPDEAELRAAIKTALKKAMDSPSLFQPIFERLAQAPFIVEDYPGGLIIREKRAGVFNEEWTPSDSPVLLTDHLRQVGDLARQFAQACRLPEALIDDVALAGYWHDIGKADPRYQRTLYDPLLRLPYFPQPEIYLAKSIGLRSPRRHHPRGFRHECLSEWLILNTPTALDKARDKDLLCHLVASHHGFARPLFAPYSDPEAPALSLVIGRDRFEAPPLVDVGWTAFDIERIERFSRLRRRYGWWGLCYLEAIVRTADWKASALTETSQPQPM